MTSITQQDVPSPIHLGNHLSFIEKARKLRHYQEMQQKCEIKIRENEESLRQLKSNKYGTSKEFQVNVEKIEEAIKELRKRLEAIKAKVSLYSQPFFNTPNILGNSMDISPAGAATIRFTFGQ